MEEIEVIEYINAEDRYVTRDWAWLQSIWGCQLLRPQHWKTQTIWKLFKIVVREDISSINLHSCNPDGSPCTGVYGVFTWPKLDAPANDEAFSDLTKDPNLVRIYCNKGKVQVTEGNDGQTGFGVSQSGWYVDGDGTPGPGSMWPLSFTNDAEGITGLGMLGSTDHRGPCHLYWKLANVENTTPPPATEGTVIGNLEAALVDLSDLDGKISDAIDAVETALIMLRGA